LENIPSQWNNFRIIYGKHKLFIKFKVIVETQKLSIWNLNPERLFRLELMKSLSDKGFSTREISDYLNDRNIRTVRTNIQYTPKDVWVGLQKYKIRLSQKENYKILYKSEDLCVTSNKFTIPE
tara:strand:- start:1901 stop:2269 length:369 start_codon:yes stop_codon:yes gene_type:complete